MSKPFTARDVANLVIAELKPLLEAVSARMPGPGELEAINAGIKSILSVQTDIGERVERNGATLQELVADVAQLDKTAEHNADNFTALVEEVRGYHTRTIAHYDALGRRVVKLEDWRKGGDNEETKLVEGLER